VKFPALPTLSFHRTFSSAVGWMAVSSAGLSLGSLEENGFSFSTDEQAPSNSAGTMASRIGAHADSHGSHLAAPSESRLVWIISL
jgi:hypothetical protein